MIYMYFCLTYLSWQNDPPYRLADTYNDLTTHNPCLNLRPVQLYSDKCCLGGSGNWAGLVHKKSAHFSSQLMADLLLLGIVSKVSRIQNSCLSTLMNSSNFCSVFFLREKDYTNAYCLTN